MGLVRYEGEGECVIVWGMQDYPQSTLSLCGTTLLVANDYDLGTYHTLDVLN